MSRPRRDEGPAPKREDLLRTARSWQQKFLRDAYTHTLGVVYGYEETEETVYLCARFAPDPDGVLPEDRRINLQVPSDPHDLDYIHPEHTKARYRPLQQADRERLQQLAQRS